MAFKIRWPFVSRRKYENLRLENVQLKKDLIEAQKNDRRDEKGRFTHA